MLLWLIDKRKSRGLSQNSVAKACGISQQAYSFIENSTRRPSVQVAKKIALTLRFNWTLFFENNENAS